MKTILLALLTILLSTLFISCAKVPFTKSTVKQNAALVYVYAVRESDSIDVGTRMQVYKISINGKTTKGFVKGYEYTSYDLKAGAIIFTASRNDVEKQELKLDLVEGKTYYIRLNSIGEDWGKFDFKLVSETQALKEIQETTLAGAYKNDDSIISALIPSKEDSPKTQNTVNKISTQDIQTMIDTRVAKKVSTSTTATKLENIREAYEMQKQGLLTKEEFKTMKAEILAK